MCGDFFKFDADALHPFGVVWCGIVINWCGMRSCFTPLRRESRFASLRLNIFFEACTAESWTQ